jgi:hypothetical protein
MYGGNMSKLLCNMSKLSTGENHLLRSFIQRLILLTLGISCFGLGAFAQTACWTAWSSSSVYTAGAQVSYSGENYQAAYWTRGNNPSTSSGVAGSGQPWIPEGSCSGTSDGGGTVSQPAALCANENGACSFTGVAGVSFGANSSFYSKMASTSIACNDATFGDPDVGVGKSCYIRNYTLCASENGTCSFNGVADVAFGAGNSFYNRTATNSIACNDATFGDPDVGVAKSCYYYMRTDCAAENSTCSFTGTGDVAFGAASSWVGFPSVGNSIACNDATFGDPDYGVAKACYVMVLAPVSGGNSGTGAAAGFIFSPYKDVTIDANWNTGAQQSNATGTSQAVTSAMPNQNLTWAFASGTCGSESWAGITPAQEATNVQAFVNAGKYYTVSTGGSGATFDCPSGSAFLSFIKTYYSANMLGVDFDIENGQGQAIVDDLINAAIAGEQQYPNLRFSFTIATFGGSANPILGSEGVLVVSEIQRLGLGGNYTINLMTMDYGSAAAYNCVVVNGACEMGQSAIQAAQSLNSQYGIPYSHIEITPDIGQNDTQGEIFTLADVDTVAAFIKSNGLAGAHFWSFDRDTPTCTSGASTCNGNGAASLAYTNEFKNDLGVK